MMYDYLIIPSLISGITYVTYIRSDDIYRIIKLNTYYFYKYSLFDGIFILLYFFNIWKKKMGERNITTSSKWRRMGGGGYES